MGTSKAIGFVFILFWISTVNALVQLPRKHIVDYTTFSTQLSNAVSYEFIWKAIWEFTADSEADIDLRYGPEYLFEISSTVMDLYSNTMDLNTNLCSEGGRQFSHPPSNLAAFLSGTTYLAFLSSNPTEYLWMFECDLNVENNCPEAGAKITFLFNQGLNSPFKRPEGINWTRALKDLYQATRLRLEDVRGSWRAVYKYKSLTRNVHVLWQWLYGLINSYHSFAGAI